MVVSCPGCNTEWQVDPQAALRASSQGLVVQCPQCHMGGRLQTGALLLATEPTPQQEAPRSVAFVCRCGYQTDLPERFRHRMGRCPACGEQVMAGEVGASGPVILLALRDVMHSKLQSPVSRPVHLDRRLSLRVPAPQLTARLPGADWRLPVGNLSATGIALLAMPRGLPASAPMLLTLQERDTPVLPLVRSRVVRQDRLEAGLIFEGLTMAQRRLLRLLLVRVARRANGHSIPPVVPPPAARPDATDCATAQALPPALKVA